jgi:DNA adenine methylase
VVSIAMRDAPAAETLRSPFPWFGGKRRVASLVWSRLGDVDSYNEPFAGSLAVLLGRPNEPRVETVNDLDCYLANFWRALQHDPDGVAYWADAPVNEADLHARHRWLVLSRKAAASMARVKVEPDYFDAKIAGWWVWGQCLWIGSGWCEKPEQRRMMSISRPRSGEVGAGSIPPRRWQGGGQGGGSGVHAPTLTKQQLPSIGGECGGGTGVQRVALTKSDGLYDYLGELAARLRRVRVCCGDWRRILTPSVTTYVGLTGVFLDPPYAHDLRERCYSEDHDISGDVRQWAIEHGDDPKMRIALCGYEGEHVMPASWACVPWKAHGGYSRSERGVANRERERIWFSPHCLRPGGGLFDEAAGV